MPTPSSTVTIWESGRLVLVPPRRPLLARFERDHWIGAALLVLCALLLTVYVCLLERVVARSELRQDEQRERAIAEAQCERTQPADARGGCRAIFDGGQVAATTRDVDAAPGNDVAERVAALPAASLAPATAGLTSP